MDRLIKGETSRKAVMMMRMGEDAKGVIPSFHAYQEGLGGLIDYEHPDEGRGWKWSSRSTNMKTDEKQTESSRQEENHK